MIIQRINIWFMCDFYSMRCFGPICIVRPKQACDWCENYIIYFFRFRREILYQLPPLERFLMTISSIWCHLLKSTHTRPVRFSVQSSVLESSFDTPTPEPGSTMLAPPLFILLSWNIPRHIVWKQAAYRIEMGFFGKKSCGIITKWMKP